MTSQVIRNYVIKELLGKGSYGVVYKVTKNSTVIINTDDKQFYVLKQISLLGMDKTQIEEVKSEAKIMSSLNNQYIVKFYENFLEDNNLNIVMEYCDGGDLSKFLQVNFSTGKFIKEEKIWRIFLQIVMGVAYIHKKNILHRDLKTLNIFLTKDEKVRIGDLGVAKVLSATSGFASTFVGTPYYLSPEMCEEKPYNEKSDIWALGCILYEMSTYKHPFNAKNPASLCLKILTAQYEPIHKDFSNDLKKMIELLLEKNYNKRPGIFEIINHSSIDDLRLVIKTRAKKYSFDLSLGESSEVMELKRGKTEEIAEIFEVKSKVAEEKSQKKDVKAVEKKILKELDKNKNRKVGMENPMRNIFINNNGRQSSNNIISQNQPKQNANPPQNKILVKHKTPKANIAVKYSKNQKTPVKLKDNLSSNPSSQDISSKDNGKDAIIRDKINAFESKLNQDCRKPATPDANALRKQPTKENIFDQKRQSTPFAPVTPVVNQADFEKYNLNKKIISELEKPNIKLVEDAPMRLPKVKKEKVKKVKKSDSMIAEDVTFLKNVIPEKEIEKITKENIPQNEVASIVKEKYLETLRKNPEKHHIIKAENSEERKNELFKELFGNFDNFLKIISVHSSNQFEESKTESTQFDSKEFKSQQSQASEKRKIGFNANIINAGNFKINTDDSEDNRVPLCLNNNTVNFKLSKICYKENINDQASSEENSQIDENEIPENEFEEEQDEEVSRKNYNNHNNFKNNRYSDFIEEDEEDKREETEDCTEEVVTVIKNENDPNQQMIEDFKRKRHEFSCKVEELKKQCILIIGETKFNKIYQFYLNQCEKNKELDNSDNDKINDYIFQEVSISNVEFMPHFCQIIYYELQLQYIDQELSK